jgi:flagellar biosynthesis protein FliQ
VSPTTLLEQAQNALLLSLAVALPVLVVAAVVGLIVAAFQAASQIQDPTIAHLPRLVAVVVALVVVGPWMGSQIGAFAEQMMTIASAPR